MALLVWTVGYAQPSGQPGFDRKWITAQDSKEKVEALNEHAFAIAKDSVDASLHYASLAEQAALHIGDSLGLAQSWRRMGMGHKRKGDPEMALGYFRKSLGLSQRAGDRAGVQSNAQKIGGIYLDQGNLEGALEMLTLAWEINRSDKDLEAEAITLNLLGPTYQRMGKWDLALDAFFRSLEIRKRLNDQKGILLNYTNIGLMYLDYGRLDKAEEFIRRAIEQARTIGSKGDLADAHLNLCAVFNKKEDHDLVAAHADSALTLYREIDRPTGIGKALLNLATVDMNKGRLDEAALKLRSALEQFKHLEISEDVIKAHQNLGTLAIMQNDLKGAAEELKLALDLARTNGNRNEERHALKALAEVKQEQGHLDEALALFREFLELKNSMLNETATEQLAVAEMREKYDTELRIREIEELKVREQLEREQKERRTAQLYVMVGAAVLLFVVLLLLYRNNKHIRKARIQEQALYQQRVNDLLKQQEIRSLDAMMQGQEKERQRIAKDLHDRLGSMLSAIKLQFSALEGRLTQMESQHKDQYLHVFGLLDEAVTEVRRISHDMIRGTISQFGLQRALEDLLAAVETPGKLQVELSTYGLEQRLEQKLEIAVYRMVQEMVSNALKHSRASELSMQVTRSAGALNLIVEDNGIGYDPAKVNEGMGLGNIRSRAAEFKGVVHVDTRSGRGTIISVDIPLAPPPATT